MKTQKAVDFQSTSNRNSPCFQVLNQKHRQKWKGLGRLKQNLMATMATRFKKPVMGARLAIVISVD